jgi:hypothetical protein
LNQYPEDRLDGLLTLTDETGIIQHTKYSIIDRRHGYTSDDNARALIAALRHHNQYKKEISLNLAKKYLIFLLGMHREDGKFHNLLGYNKDYHDEEGTEDSLGHILWALGATMNSTATPEMKKAAKWLFDETLPHARELSSPRARAYTILGLTEYHQANPNDKNIPPNIQHFSDQLVNQYNIESTNDWKWYERYMTYANARLPHALITAYNQIGEEKYLKTAEESLNFSIKTQFTGSIFHPIGTQGWYHRGGRKAEYDQQPLEASCLVDACIAQARLRDKEKYHKIALNAFQWYYGKNTKHTSLINTNNFTCYDGLTHQGLNLNQGAESTISYYLAYLTLEQNNLL